MKQNSAQHILSLIKSCDSFIMIIINEIVGVVMESLSANEAKTHFGHLLLKVQREPIQINRNGKAIAVVLSIDDYQQLEALKIQFLNTRIEQAKNDIAEGRLSDGHAFMAQLMDGEFDLK